MEDKNQKPDINQKAVALNYRPGDRSPKVVATGQGFVAQKILENARENNVPIYEDKALVSELSKLEIGNNIPSELYDVVAQILVFVSDLDRKEELKRYGSK